MKTAVIYARYSSDSQTEQSIEGQLRVCKEYAQKNDIVIVDTYIDRAMSGTNDNRVAFQKMIKDSNNHQFSIVLVYKLDRFSRNKYESVIHKKTLKDNGVRIVSCMENIPDTPEGTLMEALLEGFNQYFSEELTQKVNRGLRESWLKGNATGGAHVFGYDIVNKKYVVNEYEKDIVLKCFNMYSNGYRARVIAETLNEQGYHRINGKKFDKKYVLFILHNSRYTGVVEHHGVIYDKIFPRIIDDILWNKVNAINEENKLAPSRKKEIYDYILSGKLICGKCNHKMFGESGTSHTKDIHYYYSCSSKRKKRCNCDKKSIQKQLLEDTVINAISKLLGTEQNIEYLSSKIFEYHKNQMKDNTNLKLLEKQRKDIFKSSQNMLKAIEQGIITDMTKTRLQQLETELAEIDIEINKEKLKDYSLLSKEEIEHFLRKNVFEDMSDIKIRKLVINTLVRQIHLYEDKIVILFNFTTPPDKPKLTLEENIQTDEQITSALNNPQSSCLLPQSAPKKPVPLKRLFYFI
ncbi:MAG: recombinase family protein [Firmicutes bacterium]|nr:recombinase family protein [Bacillota bacterium]MCI7003349.1 recombinase family protein [Clostridia bacterium]